MTNLETTKFKARGKLEIVEMPIAALKPYPHNARTHSPEQVEQIAASIREFEFSSPVLIDKDCEVIAGHGRIEAAKLAGMDTVPTIRLEHLSPAQVKAYRLADNRLAELAGWDLEVLKLEFMDLMEIETEFDLGITGFDTVDIDLILEQTQTEEEDPSESVNFPDETDPTVSQSGDLWELGDHRLLCGNALESVSYTALMAGEKANMTFTDPPYNVPIEGHVSVSGAISHPEFAMAYGELSPDEFTAFLQRAFTHLVKNSASGSIHFICTDWRHLGEMFAAGNATYTELKNLIVWAKTNGGMGSFYRSRHELILVFKNGTAPHVNNFGLGETGRYRTNVWTYAGVNTFRKGRMEDLAAHPTVKPTPMVADAIRDCSHHGDLILDPFAGSGTTILAAERTRRKARCMEIDPGYVDIAVRRWQEVTGADATLTETGETFDEVAARRTATPDNNTPENEPCASPGMANEEK